MHEGDELDKMIEIACAMIAMEDIVRGMCCELPIYMHYSHLCGLVFVNRIVNGIYG